MRVDSSWPWTSENMFYTFCVGLIHCILPGNFNKSYKKTWLNIASEREFYRIPKASTGNLRLTKSFCIFGRLNRLLAPNIKLTRHLDIDNFNRF